MNKPKLDVGLIWAKGINIWGQVGSVAGAVNFLMMIGVFYTTTAKPNWLIPLWAYITVIVLGGVLVIGFIIKKGISGYYRFLSEQSRIDEVEKKVDESNRKIDLIINHLDIKG
jgi:hypothetical protein